MARIGDPFDTIPRMLGCERKVVQPDMGGRHQTTCGCWHRKPSQHNFESLGALVEFARNRWPDMQLILFKDLAQIYRGLEGGRFTMHEAYVTSDAGPNDLWRAANAVLNGLKLELEECPHCITGENIS